MIGARWCFARVNCNVWRLMWASFILIIFVINVTMFLNVDVRIKGSKTTVKYSFESDASVTLRTFIENHLLSALRVKRSDPEYFNKREGYRETYFDSLPLVREVEDYRPGGCSKLKYNIKKERISIIMNYRNEPLSLVIRTIYSILRHTPHTYMHQLIIVDDGSNLDSFDSLDLIKPLLDSLNTNVLYHRNNESLGLIACRRWAAQHATGQVIIVLDSHVEVRDGWFEPLLNVTQSNHKALAVPIWDMYSSHTGKVDHYEGGYLMFDIFFRWRTYNLPDDFPKHYNYRASALMGGAFAINREWFKRLDYYGRGMQGWGGENFELALKIWRCGGEIWKVPCSRIYHVSAWRSPEKHNDRPKAVHMNLNKAILSKSFMTEDHFKLFDEVLGAGVPYNLIDDTVKFNQQLMVNLKCDRTYSWLQHELMDRIETWDNTTLLALQLKSSDGRCPYSSLTNNKHRDSNMVLKPCVSNSHPDNIARLTRKNELRLSFYDCIDSGYDDKPPIITECHRSKGHQYFEYDPINKQLKDVYGKCLDEKLTGVLDFVPCDTVKLKWIFEKTFQ